MWQFADVIHGMRDACVALNVPVVSGNVSFYNETDGTPIYPTPTIGMVGLLERVECAVTPWFKSPAISWCFSGAPARNWAAANISSSIHGLTRGTPPWIDLKMEQAVQSCCREAIEQGLLRSAHDVSDGGLGGGAGRVLYHRPGKAIGRPHREP